MAPIFIILCNWDLEYVILKIRIYFKIKKIFLVFKSVGFNKADNFYKNQWDLLENCY